MNNYKLNSKKNNQQLYAIPPVIQNKINRLKLKSDYRPYHQVVINNKVICLSYMSNNSCMNLNGEVTSARNDEKIYCRHLVHYNLTVGIKTEFYSLQLSTIDGIKKIPLLNNVYYDQYDIEENDKECCRSNMNDFGKKLSEVAKNLKENQTARLYTIINTTPARHAIGVTVTKKKSRYIVKVYDPNRTCRHSRYIFPDAESVAYITKSRDFVREIIDRYANGIEDLSLDDTLVLYDFDQPKNNKKSLKRLILHDNYLNNLNDRVVDKQDFLSYFLDLPQMRDTGNYSQVCRAVLSGLNEAKLTAVDKYKALRGRYLNNDSVFNDNNQMETIIAGIPDLTEDVLDMIVDNDEFSKHQKVALLRGYENGNDKYLSIYQQIVMTGNTPCFDDYVDNILMNKKITFWMKVCLLTLKQNNYPVIGKPTYQDFVKKVEESPDLNKYQKQCLINLCSKTNIDDLRANDCAWIKKENDSLIKEIKTLLKSLNSEHKKWYENICSSILLNKKNLSPVQIHFLLQKFYLEVTWLCNVCNAIDWLANKISRFNTFFLNVPGVDNHEIKKKNRIVMKMKKMKQKLTNILKKEKNIAEFCQDNGYYFLIKHKDYATILKEKRNISKTLRKISQPCNSIVNVLLFYNFEMWHLTIDNSVYELEEKIQLLRPLLEDDNLGVGLKNKLKTIKQKLTSVLKKESVLRESCCDNNYHVLNKYEDYNTILNEQQDIEGILCELSKNYNNTAINNFFTYIFKKISSTMPFVSMPSKKIFKDQIIKSELRLKDIESKYKKELKDAGGNLSDDIIRTYIKEISKVNDQFHKQYQQLKNDMVNRFFSKFKNIFNECENNILILKMCFSDKISFNEEKYSAMGKKIEQAKEDLEKIKNNYLKNQQINILDIGNILDSDKEIQKILTTITEINKTIKADLNNYNNDHLKKPHTNISIKNNDFMLFKPFDNSDDALEEKNQINISDNIAEPDLRL